MGICNSPPLVGWTISVSPAISSDRPRSVSSPARITNGPFSAGLTVASGCCLSAFSLASVWVVALTLVLNVVLSANVSITSNDWS